MNTSKLILIIKYQLLVVFLCYGIKVEAQSFPDYGLVYNGTYYFKMMGGASGTFYTSTIGLDGSMTLGPVNRSWWFNNPVEISAPTSNGLTIRATGSRGYNAGLKFVSFMDNRNYTVFADNVGRWGVYDGSANVDRLIISKEGNVGIGIDASGVDSSMPSVPLEVGRDNAVSTVTQVYVHGNAKFNNPADHNNMTQVSINTNTLVSGAALTVAGPTYIGTWQDADTQVKSEYLQKYHLWVKRGIVSEDFAVAKANAWRDDVFKKGYLLPNLTEVAKFITQHNHLPGIPSESEVKEKGYTVNQITLAFLEKIEQLTLYAIEQDKKIKLLEAQVEQYRSNLRKEIGKLKNQILTK